MTRAPCIVWFRNDLRLADHPALASAAESGAPLIPLYVHSPEEDGRWGVGAASKVWLHASLEALDRDLRTRGAGLSVVHGPELDALRRVATATGARKVVWNRRYEPFAVARDKATMAALRADGLEVTSHPGNLLFEPWEISTKADRPVQVFTAYWRALLAKPDPVPPLPSPAAVRAYDGPVGSVPIESLGLRPVRPWDTGIRAAWSPGSAHAHARLGLFLDRLAGRYDEARDRPAEAGTSRLSPHLHFGEIGPREIWHAVGQRAQSAGVEAADWRRSRFLAEVIWREFAHHLLFHFPHTAESPLRREFEAFPWRADPSLLRTWQRGRTGYPLVDAGMRELWSTGWMHNRVRMVVASFLVKHLLQPWTDGAAWFWDTLVDADLASNTLGWQWSAGCGADAAPYFRIFNPVLQGERFDPQGDYVKRHVPELERLPARWIHRPWEAPEPELARAGIRLGANYPRPVVDHGEARATALEAFARLRNATRPSEA